MKFRAFEFNVTALIGEESKEANGTIKIKDADDSGTVVEVYDTVMKAICESAPEFLDSSELLIRIAGLES